MRLTETTFQEAAPEKIDEANGILYGCKLLGHDSRNGRRYTAEAMKKALPLYNERKGYANHAKQDALGRVVEERSIRDFIVVHRNPRYVEGKGIFGDSHFVTSDPLWPKILETAKKFPTMLGFSHVADGDTRKIAGKDEVYQINSVESIDTVSDPATTNGLFESKGAKPDQPQALKEYIDALPAGIPEAQRTTLIEAITDAWPTAPGDPQQQITMALLSAVQELARSIMDANSKSAQAEADAAAAKAAADKKAADDKAKADNPGQNVPPTLESLQRKLALIEAENAIIKSGRASADEKVRAIQIEAYADAKPEKRQALLESWPKAGEPKIRESSRPFERPDKSPPANSGGEGSADNASLKAYESRFTESVKSARERIAKRRAG